MTASIRKDIIVVNHFKDHFENALKTVSNEIASSSKESLERNGYAIKIVNDLEPSYRTPIINFTDKVTSSPEVNIVIVEIPVNNNPEIFQKIYEMSLADIRFDKTILSAFSKESNLDKGKVKFTGKTNVILADNLELLENFKKSVEKNVKIFNEYLEIYSEEYNKIKDTILIPLATSKILETKTKNNNIKKNIDSLNNW